MSTLGGLPQGELAASVRPSRLALPQAGRITSILRDGPPPALDGMPRNLPMPARRSRPSRTRPLPLLAATLVAAAACQEHTRRALAPEPGELAVPTAGDPDGLLPSAASLVFEGDWNDLDAGIDVAASYAELALIDATPASVRGRRTFLLRSTRDEYAWLVVERIGPPTHDDEGVRMKARCTVGRFGNPATEQRFLRALARRLADLKGVDVRPLSR